MPFGSVAAMRAVVWSVLLLLLVAPAASARSVGANLSWAVSADRRLEVRGTLQQPAGRRVALEVARGGSPARVGRSVPAGGRSGFRLSRAFGPTAGHVRFRVRVTRRGGRPGYAGPWRRLDLTGLPSTPAPLATPAGDQVTRAPAPGTPGELVLKTPVVAGQVVALGRTAATPDGLLVRVSSTSTSAAGETVAQVVPATLPDALPIGGFSVSLESRDQGTLGRAAATRRALPPQRPPTAGRRLRAGP